jgi:hypothetical protein
MSSVSCKKKTEDNSCAGVTITQAGIGTGCTAWAINVNGVNYISDNIPAEFKQEGRFVCARFELYDDMRLCVCCGGVRANIISMKYFVR